jgi:hypothetical protein
MLGPIFNEPIVTAKSSSSARGQAEALPTKKESRAKNKAADIRIPCELRR